MITLILGIFLGNTLNIILFFLRDYFYEVAIKDNDFERLIYRAARKPMLVSVTMKNDKVYVGYVIRTLDPGVERTELRIIPLISGYRKQDNKEVVFTTEHEEIYNIISSTGDAMNTNHPRLGDFELILPILEICSTNMFDLKAYEEFDRNRIRNLLLAK